MKFKKIISFALGPLGVAVLGILTLPLLTWIFNQADIGRLSMFQLIVSFSILISTIGLDQAFVREYHEVESKPRLLKVVALPGLVLLSVWLILYLITGFSLSEWLLDSKNTAVELLLFVAILSGFLTRFISLLARMDGEGFLYSFSMILPKIIFLALIGCLFISDYEREFEILLFAQVFSLVSVCVFLIWYKRSFIKEVVKEKYDKSQLHTVLSYSWPLVFSSVAYWGLTAMDKVFIKELSTVEELGLYSVAISFASAVMIVQSVFSTIWAPMVYKWVAQNKNLHLISVIRELLLVLICFFSILAAMLSWLTVFILPNSYENVQYLIVVCMIQPLLYTLSEVTKVGIGITRRSSFSLIATLVALCVNLVGNYHLIPIYGANGAAIATALSFFVFLVIRTEASIYVWQAIPRIKMYVVVSFIITFDILFLFNGHELDNLTRLLVGSLLLIPFALYSNRAKSLLVKLKES